MPACKDIAKRAYKTDPYLGVVFTDPFDGAEIRWNPVKWKLEPVAGSGDVRVWAKVPQAVRYERVVHPKSGKPYPRTVWEPARANSKDEYPVWREKLTSSFGPCYIHTLDAMFCGLVAEELARRGVRDFVAIHDAWLVPADAERELLAAVKAASRQWYKGLGRVYDDLERLLGTCTPSTRGPRKGKCCGYCANWIRKLRGIWQRRVAAGAWPEFRVGETEQLIKGM